MKTKWQIIRLEDKEIFDLQSGLWSGKTNDLVRARVLRNTNFRNDGRLSFDDVALLDVDKKQFKDRELQKMDILLERSGGGPAQPVGRVALFDKDDNYFSFSNFTSRIRVLDQTKVFPSYLLFYLLFFYKSGGTESLQARTTGIRNLNFTDYKKLEIPHPPLPTQLKIVKILDSIQSEIGAQKEIIEKTKELKKSLMKKLFSEGTRGENLKETEVGKMPESWEVVRLGDVAEVNPRSNNGLEDNARVGFITMADVSNDGYIKNIQERLYKDVKNGFTKFQSGDYLFAKITPCMENGKGGLYRNDKLYYCFGSTEFHIIRSSERILPVFISYLVNIEKFRKTAAENMSGACGQKRVPKDFLVEYKFALPSIIEQKEIASILEKVDERIESAQKQKQLHEELFNTTLNRLMSGEIDVEEVNI